MQNAHLQVTSPEGASGMQTADLKVEVPGFRGGKAESLGKRGCGEKTEEKSRAPGATPASRTLDRHESRLLTRAGSVTVSISRPSLVSTSLLCDYTLST